MQTLITALGGFLRKHKAGVVCERPDALRRYVAANELEFYAVSTFLLTDGNRPVHRRRRGADPPGGVTTTAGAVSAMTPADQGRCRHRRK